MQTEDKNNKTKEVEAKEETVGESVFFHLTVLNHESIPFFIYVNSLHYFV